MSASPYPGRLAAALIVAAGLLGCGDAPDQSSLPPDRRVAVDYAAALRVDLAEMQRRPSGLYVQDLREGVGARADSGDIVKVHYTGWLPTGVRFDTSRNREKPFEVALGYGRVIQGWDQGVVGMRVGGQRRLVIPPGMAYGDAGKGRIPGRSTLVFDIELVDVVNRTPEGE